VRNANLQAKSHIDNSTAGFATDLLGAEDLLPPGALGIPAEWWTLGARRSLTSISMLPSVEAVRYINTQTPAMITDILTKHISRFRPDRTKTFARQNVKRIPLTDTRAMSSFELMTFDQSTIDGNGDSLTHSAMVECGYQPHELEEILVLVSGDQLTMDRIRSLRFLKQNDTWGNRFNWALPMVGLFHLSMNYLKMFMKNHMGDASDISSVAGCNTLLHRERISDQVSAGIQS
jgi:hypothetical protein